MRIALILLGSLVCFLCGGAANAQSPSFDCNRARLPDEFAICRSSQLAELDNLVAAGYAFLKSTQGRPAADQVGIPFWRLRQSCRSDEACIRQRQIEAIKAYHSAGAPVTLPSWASLQVYGSISGGGTENSQIAPLAPPTRSGAGIGDTTVQLVSDGGTFKVPVTINGQLTLNFTVDSGASDVSIPADVFMTLVRTGTITDGDYLDKQTYVLADGSTTPSQRFVIRSLRVGDKTLDNVVGSIAPVKGSLLLGQSFLGRFDSWLIDNHLQALVLRSSSSAADTAAPPAPSQAAIQAEADRKATAVRDSMIDLSRLSLSVMFGPMYGGEAIGEWKPMGPEISATVVNHSNKTLRAVEIKVQGRDCQQCYVSEEWDERYTVEVPPGQQRNFGAQSWRIGSDGRYYTWQLLTASSCPWANGGWRSPDNHLVCP